MLHDPLRAALARKALYGLGGCATGSLLASGHGWSVDDVICTSGPRDLSFEERHPYVTVAVVLCGSFSYRSGRPRQVMTPGSLLLGNAEHPFCCGHEDGEGDRCLSFHFDPAVVEGVAEDLGLRHAAFTIDRIPPCRASSHLICGAQLLPVQPVRCEETALRVLAFALRHSGDCRYRAVTSRHHRAVVEVARLMESQFHEPLTISELAREAGLSPFHFLRVFKATVGTTPHQFLLRTRLRASARLLAATRMRVCDVAYECGFGDLPNFNRDFRSELGQTPMQWRATHTLRLAAASR